MSSDPRPSSPSDQIRLLHEVERLRNERNAAQRTLAERDQELAANEFELAAREAEVASLSAALAVERVARQRAEIALAAALSEMTVIVKHDSRRS